MEKFSFKSLLTIIVVLLIGIVGLLRIQQSAKKVSAWFNDSWQYRKVITVGYTGATTLTDFQVSVDIGTSALIAAGKMQSDCDDIRFTDQNGKLLNHWIEENNPGCNQTTDTKIWVKMPKVNTTGTKIYLYYGNSTATSISDVSKAFGPLQKLSLGATYSVASAPHVSYPDTGGTQLTNGSTREQLYQTTEATVGWSTTNPEIIVNLPKKSVLSYFKVYAGGGGAGGINIPTFATIQSSIDNSTYATVGTGSSYSNTEQWITINATNDTYSKYTKFIFGRNGWVMLGELEIYGYPGANIISSEPIHSISTEEQSPAPIAYWKFDEGVGTTIYDSSSNQNHGAFGAGSTAPSWLTSENCIAGSCLSFNGTSNFLVLPSVTGAKSISMWAYLNSGQSSSRYLFDARTGLTNGYVYTAAVGAAWSKMYVNGIETAKNWSSIPQDQWVHLYFEASSNFTDNINLMSRYSNTELKSGKLDDVKLYAYARTATQIKQDYNAGKANIAAAQGGNVNIGGTQTSNFKDSLIAHYKFDEGYGTTVHNTGTSGSTYDGTFATGTSAPTWTMGKNNKGLSFGGNDYVSIGDTGALNFTSSFTISAWIKTTQDLGTGNYGAILGKGHLQVANGYGFFIDGDDSDHVTFQVRNGSKIASLSSSTINDNQWHHIVGVRDHDNNTSYFYVDGNLIGSTLVALSSGYVSSKPFGIGGRNDNTWNYYYSGLIDDVKIYNTALTADEVKLDYNQGAQFVMGKSNQTIGGTTTNLDYCIPGDTTACSPPVAEWKFEEGVGTTTYDTAGSNNGVLGAGNAAPIWAQGKIGKSMKFDGTDDYVKINNPSSLNFTENDSVSYSFWIKPFSFNNKSFPTIYNRGDQSSTVGYSWIHFMNGSNNISYHYTNGSGYTILTLGTSLPINQWTHVSINHNLGTKTVNTFVNGQLKDTDTYVNTAVGVSTGDSYIGIYQASSANFPFNGLIDNFRIYNYARTPAQIAYDYNKGAPIAHWKMDECEGNIVHDASGLGNTGTITIGAGGSQVSLGTCGAGDTTAWSNGSTGKINSAMSFDGTDDFAYASSTNLLNLIGSAYSISLWVKDDTPSSVLNSVYHRIVSFANGTTNIQLGLGNETSGGGDRIFYIQEAGNGAVKQVTSGNASSGWHHVTATSNGSGSWNIYLDGVLSNNGTTMSSSSTPYVTNTGYIYIGQRGNGGYTNGLVDDVRIYNYALTSEQVKQIYNGGAVNFR